MSTTNKMILSGIVAILVVVSLSSYSIIQIKKAFAQESCTGSCWTQEQEEKSQKFFSELDALCKELKTKGDVPLNDTAKATNELKCP